MATVYTVAQLLAAAPSSLPKSITIQDTAANISHAFGALFANADVRGIVITDNAALSLPPADFFEALSPGLYGRALSIGNLNGSRVSLSAMSADTVSQLLAAEARHQAPPPIVADTAANIAAALTQLNGDSHVSTIYVQDGGTLCLTATQYTAGGKALGEIVTATSVTVSVTASTKGQSFVATGLNTTWNLQNTGDSFTFHAGFGQDVIAGYQAGKDSFSVDHLLFANFAAMISHAANDGRGNVVITYNAKETITLTGTSVAQLQSHQGDWHFI
jgi:hypothetical protein